MNSFTNFLGIGLKLLWLTLENRKQVIETISSSFFGQVSRPGLGLNIYLMLLKNLQISNYSLGYAKYKSITTSFQNEALGSIFFNTKVILCQLIRGIVQGNNSILEGEDLSNGLETMLLVLQYPFNTCYMEYTGEQTNDNSTAITSFPDSWKPDFIDLEYFKGLLHLLELRSLNPELKLVIVKILSKIASAKRSLVPAELETNQTYIGFLMQLPGQVARLINLEDSFYLEELIEMIERIVNVWGISRLFEMQQDRVSDYLNALLAVSKCVLQKNHRLNEKVFNSTNLIWRSISMQANAICTNALKPFLEMYAECMFGENSFVNIFQDVSYSQHQKFKELIQDRYKLFEAIHLRHKELACQFYLGTSRTVLKDFESLLVGISQQKMEPKVVSSKTSKFLNFMYLVCSSILNENSYSYGRRSNILIENLSPEDVEGTILGTLINMISHLEKLNNHLDVEKALT